MLAKEIPNLDWCKEKSKATGIDIRCPFATVDSCPRYYQSLSLLGKAGSTSISKREDKRLFEKWKTTDLWPRTAEYETSISGSEGVPRQFSNFCPEVAFDRFGYFVTYLEILGRNSEILGTQYLIQSSLRYLCSWVGRVERSHEMVSVLFFAIKNNELHVYLRAKQKS